MTLPDRFDRRLPELLETLAAPSVPDYFDDILSRTVRTRQRPAWTSIERWLPLDLAARAPAGVRLVPPMRLVLILLLVALVATVALIGSSRLTRTLDPFGPAANGLIAFDRGGDLFTVDPATGAETLLVAGDAKDFGVGWTRDGSGLNFLRGTDEATLVPMLANADGSNIRPLSPTAFDTISWGDWSPDGSQIVMAHLVDGREALSIVDRASGDARRLDTGTIVPSYMALWRGPTGADILFLGSPGGSTTTQGIYLIEPDGQNLRTVQEQGSGAPDNPDARPYGNIRLTEDGTKVVYDRWEPEAVQGALTRGMNIHVLDVATGEDVRMMYASEFRGSETSPALSPDGTMIAFESQARSNQAVFMVAPIDGLSEPARVVSNVYRWTDGDRSIGFSPDGRQLLVTLPGQPPELVDLASGKSTGVTLPYSAATTGWQRRLP